MAKSSELVRGAGMAAEIWTRIEEEVVLLGGKPEDLHFLARDEGMSLRKKIAELLVKAGAVARNVYPVTTTSEHGDDYSKLFASLLEEGSYGYKNPNITPVNFPGEYPGDFEGMLYHPNRSMSSEDVLKELDEMGLRPATMIELLLFGFRFPEIQREFPVVALGQSWVDPHYGRVVGSLSRWSGERGLYLGQWAVDWRAYCRFLAVRKSQALVA